MIDMDVQFDFSDILASTLHDTKNSLGMLFSTLEEMIGQCREQPCELYHKLYMLQYEAKRLNHSLIRLLTLYKANKSQLLLNIDYYSVSDFIDDIILQNEPILISKSISIERDCPDNIFKAFDRGLVAGVLDNILNNAFRYTNDKIRICAREESDYLALSIEDNGSGYPEHMLICGGQETGSSRTRVDFGTGSTGLGLYFSLLVAGSHRNRDKQGYISIVNGGNYGGGIFTIFLP
jgi:two-component system, OmpR family, sensor histidine kinase SenX3